MSDASGLPPPANDLNAMGVLTRREIEARLLAPLLQALCAEFDRERVLETVRQVIVQIAREQGAQLAEQAGGCTLAHYSGALEAWKKDDAMLIDVLEENDSRFFFNVRRCRYAEMYQALGITELGGILSCNRDYALIEGFNPEVELQRTQTIMDGAPFCDFRYRLRKNEEPGKMKTLLIMRHAKSSWDDDRLHDHDRPLNKRGKLNAPRMGRLLRELDLVPDLILTSSARRARDTAQAVADQSGYAGDVKVEEDLYAAPPEAYLEALKEVEEGCERIMVVGHNPGLEELLEGLTGEQEALPTAAIARVDLPIQSWRELTEETGSKLVNVWRPKELP